MRDYYKFLPQEHDQHGRKPMVCTRCNCKVPMPGEIKKDPRLL
jgi:hypothetical protein